MIWTLQNLLKATQVIKVKAKAAPKVKARMKVRIKAKANPLKNQVITSRIKAVGGTMTIMEDQMVETQVGAKPPGINKVAIQQIPAIPLVLGIKANSSNTGTQAVKTLTTSGHIRRIRSQESFPNYSGFYFVQHVKFFEALVAALTVRSIPGWIAHGTDAKLHWGKTSHVTYARIMQLGWDIKLEPAAGLIKLLHGSLHLTSQSVSSLGT